MSIQQSLLSQLRADADIPDDVMVFILGRMGSLITSGDRAVGKKAQVYVYVWDSEECTTDGVKLVGLRQTSPSPAHSNEDTP